MSRARYAAAFGLGALVTPVTYELVIHLLGRNTIDPSYRKEK